ncbi:sce7725 family protein [Paenarthrobacter nitroguajacolicus]|uniref:sce7725 family protein n=1 Tax=Paenarthrobacter nitroguajacolicus TaxID=211146 RepID=UPI0015BDAC41|nr:sce7725 family protein [Paenarthrobacter nitroguajacolicus]
MYFPYLYARQGECRAIEDLAPGLGASAQKVFPVLEPAATNSRDLVRTLKALAQHDRACYLIINPSKKSLNQSSVFGPWMAEVSPFLSDPQITRPTLEVRASTSLADISSFLTTYSGRSLGLSIRSSHIPAVDVAAATSGHDVLHFLHSSADPVGYSAAVGANRSVEVRDSFRTESRNADYVGAEQFTASHLYFAGEGRPGFSDYTLLPGKFSDSGGPLGAAVIHLSFVESSSRSLWVEHFVSIETRQHEGSQPSKLMEAMTKLDAAVRANPSKFVSTPGLSSYQAQFASRTPTSPTYNKRQQISHHIATAATVV